MTTKTYILRNERDAQRLAQEIISIPLVKPVAITIETGASARSIAQNRLQRLWLNEAAEQLRDDSAEGYRAYCKLHLGIPILAAGLDGFEEKYNRVFGALTYEQKLESMALPLDFPVTRLMNTKQKTEYLDAMWHFFSARGVKLTDPSGLWR